MIYFILGLIIGVVIGIMFMCKLQKDTCLLCKEREDADIADYID